MTPVLAQLGRDLRHAFRACWRVPGVAAVVIASLALGIGANATVFSWVQARILEPIGGVSGGARFHFIEPRGEGGSYPGTSWLEYRDVRDRVTAFDSVIAFRLSPLNAGPADRPDRITSMLVSDNYFDALRLAPARGRFFRASAPDDRGSAGDDANEPVAVISHRYWQTQFAGSDDVIGQVIRLNELPVSIIGVTPRRFQGTAMGLQSDLWVPARMAPLLFEGAQELEIRGQRAYSVLAALRPGASRAQAQADIDRVMRDLSQQYPATNTAITAEVLPFWQSPRGPQRFISTAVSVLQAAMLLVLAAVCANAATLLLARGAARRHEIAVRVALGAPRWRVVSLLLSESVVFAMFGAGAGALLAVWGASAFRAVPMPSPGGMTVEMFTSVNWTTVWFAAGLGLVTAIAVGMMPALQLSRVPPQAALREVLVAGGRGRGRDVIMVVQAALAVVVLVVAALFVWQLNDARATDPGFDRDGVMLAAYDLRGRSRSVDPAASTSFAAELLTRLGATPSVDAAALATSVPLDIHGLPSRQYSLEGSERADGQADRALTNTVSPGYFRTMGIALMRGADFADLLDPAAPAQAVVNETFQRRHGPRDVLGRIIDSGGRRHVIVGIVADTLYNAYGEPPTPFIYLSLRDRPSSSAEIHVRRRAGTDAAITGDVRRIVRDLNPTVPLFNVRTLTEHVEANLVFQRIPARLFGTLGPVLLAVVALGVYAVVSHSISRRRAEIAVRMALGGTPRTVARQFVAESMQIVGLGTAAGAIIGWLIVSESSLSTAEGLVIIAGVALALCAFALVASWLPIRRAVTGTPQAFMRAT